MVTPRSIRFDQDVSARLSMYVSRHPAESGNAVAVRLVDEGLRMDEHPSVVFRDGPTGRRACLISGPDVWEVIRTVRATRAAESDLDELELLGLVADNSGTPMPLLRAAVDYWAAYPSEIDALVALADEAEDAQLLRWERSRALLGR